MAIDTKESNEEKLKRFGVFKSRPQKQNRKYDMRNVLSCVLFISIVVSLVFAMISAVAIDDGSTAGNNASNKPAYVTYSDGTKSKIAGSENWGNWNSNNSNKKSGVNVGTVTVLWFLAIIIEAFLLCVSQKKIMPNLETKKLAIATGTTLLFILILLIYTVVQLVK